MEGSISAAGGDDLRGTPGDPVIGGFGELEVTVCGIRVADVDFIGSGGGEGIEMADVTDGIEEPGPAPDVCVPGGPTICGSQKLEVSVYEIVVADVDMVWIRGV